MLTSIHGGGEEQSPDTSERLRFVSGWFRVLGFIYVGFWVFAGFAFAVVGLISREAGAKVLLPIGVVGATIGILITAPLYFWFSAIAAGVAEIVDQTRARS